MRAVTMINLRFVSGSGDRDRCEFCNLLPAGGCIGLSRLRSISTRVGERDLRRLDCDKPAAERSVPEYVRFLRYLVAATRLAEFLGIACAINSSQETRLSESRGR